MIILVLFAFLGGVVTILSPCILPILPIVLAGSATGSRRRPYGIVLGFVLSFTFFTLFLSKLVQVLNISADSLRYLSIFILVIFGLVLVLPQIQVLAEKIISRFSSRLKISGSRQGFWGGLMIGFSLGLLWTPCVGPILASVITLALSGSVTASALVITLAYALGTGLPMLVIMFGGRQLLMKVPWLLNNSQKIQRVFGLVMMIMALLIFFNLDRRFQSYILEKFPNYGTVLTGFEDNQLIRQQLDKNMDQDSQINLAPELRLGGQWLNSDPLTLESLRGKVVLLDFMTYSCINCIRVFPYLEAWHQAYQDQGLVVIGIHTPEFEFEKNADNVQDALDDFGLTFPVMQDNDYATWRAFKNRYWPHTFLIDHRGEIVYDHIGEGNYDKTEKKIKELLDLKSKEIVADNLEPEISASQSPETYFGSLRNRNFGNPDFQAPDSVKENTLYLIGDWQITDEYAKNQSATDRIIFKYKAKKIFMVAASQEPVTVLIRQDGQDIKTLTIQDESIYELVANPSADWHTIEILPQGEGLEAFTFTFG